jgi:hypothetical protein
VLTVLRLTQGAAPLHRVSVVADATSLGRVEPVPNARDSSAPPDGVSRDAARLAATLLLGGLGAEAVALGTRAQWRAPEFDAAYGWIAAAYPLNVAGSVFFDVWHNTVADLAHPVHLAGLLALARELDRVGEISGDDARELATAAMEAAARSLTATAIVEN